MDQTPGSPPQARISTCSKANVEAALVHSWGCLPCSPLLRQVLVLPQVPPPTPTAWWGLRNERYAGSSTGPRGAWHEGAWGRRGWVEPVSYSHKRELGHSVPLASPQNPCFLHAKRASFSTRGPLSLRRGMGQEEGEAQEDKGREGRRPGGSSWGPLQWKSPVLGAAEWVRGDWSPGPSLPSDALPAACCFLPGFWGHGKAMSCAVCCCSRTRLRGRGGRKGVDWAAQWTKETPTLAWRGGARGHRAGKGPG